MMDMIVAWICSAIAELFQASANFFSDTFGYDISKFNSTFSYAAESYNIILKAGLAITLLIAGWQFIVFFWKGADKAPDPPVRAAMNTVVALCFVYFGNYIFEEIMNFCKYPYEALQSVDAVHWGTNADTWSAVVAVLQGAFAQTSILFYLVMLLLICYNMIKLLLEIVERYVVAFCLVYLSPLAASTLASSSTNGVYKKYFMMFISQCVLVFLNSWCLRMACSGLSLSANGDTDMIVPLLLCYGFLRISTKMDSYLNQIGLNAAITGSGLGGEIIAAGASLLNMGNGGGGAGGSATGTGGGVLGATKTAQQWIQRVSPLAAAGSMTRDAVVGAVKGGSEGYRSGAGMWKGTIDGAAKGIENSDNLISNTVLYKDRATRKERAFTGSQFGAEENALNEKQHQDGKISNEQYEKNKRQILDENEPENKRVDREDIEAWSANSHLAHQAFKNVRKTGGVAGAVPQKEGEEKIVSDNARVAAIAKGLGVGNQSKEAAEFIQVGFGKDGTVNEDFRMDKNGLHAQYDNREGYRHKMDVVDQAQYSTLSTPAREGFQQFRTVDGHRYYYRTTKTKLEPPTKTNE